MEYIKLTDIYTNSRNFYPQTDIENKKKQILSVGLMENLVVIRDANDHGQNFRLLSGERRFRAMMELFNEGHREFETVPCTVREPMTENEETLQLVISNTSRTKDILTVLTEEKTVLDTLKRMKASGETARGYDLTSGRLRDVAASMLGISTSKAAQIEAINNNIDPDILDALREEDNGLTFTYLYSLSTLDKEKQRATLAHWRSTGIWEKIKEKKQKPAAEAESQTAEQGKSPASPEITNEIESGAASDPAAITQAWDTSPMPDETDEAGQDNHSGYGANEGDVESPEYEEPSLPSKLSICYKCRHYEECADKGSSVDTCDRYEKRLSMQKTTEQLYSEAQAKIDKETQRKLKEMGFGEDGSMETRESKEEYEETPDDGLIRITTAAFKSLYTGRKPYIILKGTKYRTGDKLHLAEFKNGELLDGCITARIICTDTSATSAAITDGYVLAGIEIIG